jgi:16S rRNA (guanine527-N7)-methyltransferase
VTITEEQAAKISLYIRLLKSYNEHTNIYSKGAYSQIDFHIEDSVMLAHLIPLTSKTVVDMGSGSGLPSVIIAIVRPNLSVKAVESKSRKTRFLEQVREDLDLKNYVVEQSDIHEYARSIRSKPDIITAKAFAPWPKANEIAQKIAKKGTQLFIPISLTQKEALESFGSEPRIITSAPYYYIHKTY